MIHLTTVHCLTPLSGGDHHNSSVTHRPEAVFRNKYKSQTASCEVKGAYSTSASHLGPQSLLDLWLAGFQFQHDMCCQPHWPQMGCTHAHMLG